MWIFFFHETPKVCSMVKNFTNLSVGNGVAKEHRRVTMDMNNGGGLDCGSGGCWVEESKGGEIQDNCNNQKKKKEGDKFNFHLALMFVKMAFNFVWISIMKVISTMI